jgi:ribose 5-phosphate isomerase A
MDFNALLEKEDFKLPKIVGMGSGKTVENFINFLSINNLGMDKIYIPTSTQTKFLLIENGFQVSDLHVHHKIDLAVDGFDSITKDNVAIKGGGGCMTWEKLVAYSAKSFALIGSREKLSIETLIVPVEILPMASLILIRKLKEKFPQCSVAIRQTLSGKLGPIVTDFGNWIIDITIDRDEFIKLGPRATHDWIKMQVGVVETGIFTVPHRVYFV